MWILSARKPTIRKAVDRADAKKRIESVRVSLKDGSSKLMLDRFVSDAVRCWGIKHSIDDLGWLYDSSSSEQRPTVIEPDCQVYRDLIGSVLSLPAAS